MSKRSKNIVSIGAIAIFLTLAYGSGESDSGSNENSSSQASSNEQSKPQKDLTPEEKDSIRKVKIENREKSTISASELNEVYKSNEVKADQKYKGEKFYVVGKVDEISKMMGTIRVKLKVGGKYGMNSVDCKVNDEDVAASLSKGQKVTFLGKCGGKTGTSKMGSIEMEDCKLVKNLETLKKEAE